MPYDYTYEDVEKTIITGETRSDGAATITTSDSRYPYISYGDKSKLKSKITINATMTVAGTLEIGGELSGGSGGANACGQTAGNYCELVLSSDGKIENNGKVLCFGYISGDEGQISCYRIFQ